MRIHLIFHGRFPSEKAASLFVAKSAEAFSSKGVEVTLIVPRRKGVSSDDPFDFYGIKRIFDVVYVSTTDFFGRIPNFIAFWMGYITFSLSSALHIRKAAGADDIVYSNEALPLFFTSFFHKNCFYEMHDFPESKMYFFGWLLSRMRWILVHNRWKEEQVLALFPKTRRKLIMERNAVDVDAFNVGLQKTEARKRLGIAEEDILVLYTGHLYQWKGVYTLVDAALMMPRGVSVVFVGGTTEDIVALKTHAKNASNIMFMGHRSHKEIPLWQAAADVLVLPNSAREKISAYYTSPMKLFEYMASHRPIVVTDLPSIREIAGDDTATVVAPDDARALAAGIEMTVSDAQGSEIKARKGYVWVSDHTWDKRAERILAFIQS
jgi:glycosyltransferase involved in cell wall biosynthesis